MAPKPKKRRARMVYLLLAVFSFVALAPLASVAWKLIDGSREALKTSDQARQLLMASVVARGVDIHVEALRGQLAYLSSAVSRSGSSDVQGILDGVTDERVVYLRFTDLRGGNVASPPSMKPPREMDPYFLQGFRAAAERLAERRVVDLATVTVSEPIVLKANGGRALVVLAAPVVEGGAIRGVLCAIVDLQRVWEAVTDDAKGGYALFATDAKGRLFAETDLPDVEPGRDMTDSGIVKRFLENPGASETMPFEWSLGGSGPKERYLGSYDVAREKWGVFVQARERQVYGPVVAMIEKTLQWAMLSLACALLAAAIFARMLADPIKKLSEASRAYAQGEFATRVRVRSMTEVGDLADTFNLMAAELEELIRRLRLAAEENNELFLGTARALASAIDAKDPYTRGHSVRVNRYSVILARYHGLAESEIRDIHVASLLHDVGKIGVDDAILKKPGHLTKEEYEVMKQHTVIGANIMGPIRKMQRLLPGLRSHHERWTGGGYPDGTAGDAIPLMARIIAVADSFDAMTTDRPYQKGMTFEQALARVNELKGTAFEDAIVESFNRAYRAGEFRDPRNAAAPVPATPVTA
jgi:HD-GYP domain-containing protein (c-di-GMP phosphodiesterase class II)